MKIALRENHAKLSHIANFQINKLKKTSRDRRKKENERRNKCRLEREATKEIETSLKVNSLKLEGVDKSLK